VPAAIERAITVATEEGRHALLNIMVQG
jgi:hypothetical protein